MDLQWIRGSYISDELITEAENEYGIKLPEDIVSVVKYNNNGRPSLSCFDSPTSKEHELKKMLSFKKEDIENIYKFKKILNSVDPQMFPIANDPAGNLICLRNGMIVYWTHENDEIEVLANSFTEFLSSLY